MILILRAQRRICVTLFLLLLLLMLVPVELYRINVCSSQEGLRPELPPCLNGSRQQSPGILCGDGLCRCLSDREADCSGHWGQMTYIPALPTNITLVDLSCNNLSSTFFTSSTFDNLTMLQVKYLYLAYNNISSFPLGVFQGLRSLMGLYLDGNPALELSSLREIKHLDRLMVLSAKDCNIMPPPPDIFPNTLSELVEVRLDSNPHSGTYSLAGFCALPQLSQLFLLECDFRELKSSCSLSTLTRFDVSGNALRKFPDTCIGKDSIYPKLMKFSLTRNRIEVLSMKNVCLPSLTQLDLKSNFIAQYPSDTFSGDKFPMLVKLELEHNSELPGTDVVRSGSRIEIRAFNNPSLQILRLHNNGIDFTREVSDQAFANCSNLEQLGMNSNNFLGVDDQRFRLLFGQLSSMLTIDLADCMLQSIPANTFGDCFPRLNHLSLERNLIDDIPDGTFDTLLNLRYLYLYNNKIKTITEKTFGPTTRERLASLALYRNPFMCTCELRWFQRWFLTARLDDPKHYGNYKCHNLPGTTLASFELSDQACLLRLEVSVFLIQTCSVLILGFTIFSLLFRFRWHLRLLLYEAFRGRDNLRRRRLMENVFAYEVFVSYAADDLPWVRDQLTAKLEGELGLRLCLHERDFIPGNPIVDNIVDSVESSKKVLMVFSRHFVTSPWCQFELSLCLTHVMDHDDALIVVCVDDVTSHHMTSSMMAVLKTTTYLQWLGEEEEEEEGEESDAVRSFWGRLHQALREILLPDNENYV